ncbi:MAG: DUF998 domain-containing protein [Candidatus Thorarchaeota archaeon]|nr:DUF998 domain-containing protein [Candidatus Thorarchaeota archaeon]
MSFREKLAGIPKPNLAGFLGPLIALISILVAVLLSPGFSWQSNPLSDLGSWFRTDLGSFQILSAVAFNGGLIVGGLLLLYFTVSFFRMLNDWPTKIAMIAFMATSILLASVGVFSEDFPLPHILAALGFFLSIPIALGITGLAWLRFRELRLFAILMLASSVVSFLTIFQAWASTAIRELAEALIAIGWIWVVNYLHHTGRLSSIVSEP